MRAHVPAVGEQRHRTEERTANDLADHHRERQRNDPPGAPRVAVVVLAEIDVLVLELLNSKVASRDYYADHTAWGAQVCQLVASPHVRLLYDVFHMQIMEGDLIRTIQAHSGVIGHYHIAGNPGRGDPDETQEVNYPAVIRAIAETGHAGFIGHEFFPKQDALASLRAAYAMVEAALKSSSGPLDAP